MTDKSELSYELVDTPSSLEEFVKQILKARQVALDTEADSYYHYHSKICLIQAALPDDRLFLIDPLKCRDLSPLAPIFAAKDITKILHGAEYDVRVLRAAHDFEFNNIFDTLLARRAIGQGPFGLAALAEEFFNVKMSKTSQKEDWSIRPLPASMIQYALTDVRYLFKLTEILRGKLIAAKRLTWAEEEMSALSLLPALKAAGDPQGFWRIKRFNRLNDLGKSRAREIYLLRERLADKLDKASFRVLGNDALLTMAASTENDLSKLRGTSHFLRHHKTELQKALRCAETAPPPVKERQPRRPIAADKPKVLDALRQARNQRAQELDLEIGFLCPGNLLESWAKERSLRQELVGLNGWRRELLAEPFRKALETVVRSS